MEQLDFGKKLSEIRKAKGLTQEQLAEKSKITARTIQRIESGLVKPRAYTVKVISDNLGVDFFEISNFTGDEVDKMNQNSNMKDSRTILWFVKDLFNLKTNTMKKVTILSIVSIMIGFGLFALTSRSSAQETQKIDYSKFIKNDERGIIFFFPRIFPQYTANMKDTADHKIGKDLIQLYQRKIFLNGKFVGRVLEGDTVIFDNAKILFRSAHEQCLTSYSGIPNIHYFFPKGMKIDNLVTHVDTQYLYIGKHVIKDYNYKIFLDGIFQGQVKSGDSVLFKNGLIKILK